jgi:hypothetical protein
MSAPTTIDPFLLELKHAQLAGQRVLAAQRRPSSASGQRGRVGQLPVAGARLPATAGHLRHPPE